MWRRESLPKIHNRELVETIFEHSSCRIGNLIEKQIAQRQAASRYLKDLVGAGVLSEIQAECLLGPASRSSPTSGHSAAA
jgi:hypothetical protein